MCLFADLCLPFSFFRVSFFFWRVTRCCLLLLFAVCCLLLLFAVVDSRCRVSVSVVLVCCCLLLCVDVRRCLRLFAVDGCCLLSCVVVCCCVLLLSSIVVRCW